MRDFLRQLGWTPRLQSAWEQLQQPTWIPARICRETRINFSIMAEDATEKEAVLAGTLWHRAATDADLPTVGDWVAVDSGADGKLPVVRALLPRRNRFSRKVPGKSCAEQVIAANVGAVFVVTDAETDFNPKRTERYLTLIRKSGARPFILVNKADITPHRMMRQVCAELAALAPDAEVHAVCAASAEGYPDILKHPTPGTSLLLVGSSGVGKSTLVNTLTTGVNCLTGEVNEVTGKGRHTTVARELFVLPSGAVIIDNPGMREVQMWTDADTLRAQFADVDELAKHCRFADCSHKTDAGCAVRAALQRGELSPDHYEHFLCLDVEIAALQSRAEKRRMNLERVSRRGKSSILRNKADREEHRRSQNPHKLRW